MFWALRANRETDNLEISRITLHSKDRDIVNYTQKQHTLVKPMTQTHGEMTLI